MTEVQIEEFKKDYLVLEIDDLMKKYQWTKAYLYNRASFFKLKRPKTMIASKREKTNIERFGSKSSLSNKEVQEKIKKTNIEKFGCERPAQNQNIKEKTKQNNLKKYGVENPSSCEFVREKVKQTCLERYGSESSLSNKEVREKIEKTNLIKYGSKSTRSSEIINEKRNQTNINKYGFENPFENKEIQEKIKQTNLSKYGCERAADSEVVKEKIKKSNLERYGAENVLSLKFVQNKIKQTNLDKYGCENPSNNKDVRNKSRETCLVRYGYECSLSNKEVREKIIKTCIEKYGYFPVNKFGKTQSEIQEWLNSFGFNFQSNYEVLDGYEIDLYDQSLKLGIEYCGLYWHNENSPQPRTKHYHNDKRVLAELKGVRLITIFEDEWYYREVQCKNYLLSVLNKNSIKIYVDECEVKLIDKDLGKSFIDQYHIQPINQLKSYFAGLYNKAELVAVMSFSEIEAQLTLDHLCFKTDVMVIGGSSKLFKFLLNETKTNSLISWSDNRWSQGKIYEKLGFKLEEELGPDYSYTKTNGAKERLSKQSQKKSNTGCPKDVTELEWATQNGLSRIWDCGKKRWIYDCGQAKFELTL